jgi:PqqA peptide cyclase
MLTGNADNADPVCSKSPHHDKILEARREASCSDIKIAQLQFRNRTNSQLIYKQRIL